MGVSIKGVPADQVRAAARARQSQSRPTVPCNRNAALLTVGDVVANMGVSV